MNTHNLALTLTYVAIAVASIIGCYWLMPYGYMLVAMLHALQH